MLAVGGVHLEQYTVAHFSVIPTIGTLFVATFVGATVPGLVLLVPVRGAVGPRRLIFDALAFGPKRASAGAMARRAET